MDKVPALGEHTDAILTELGYTPEERAQLRRDGVV
jgi:formyl-CoA transferase